MKETNFRIAKAYFGADFDRVLAWYLEFGYVYSGKEIFVLACIHNKNSILERKLNNVLDFCDCWYIQYVSGDIKRLFEIMPEEKEWAVFERINKNPKVYKTSDLKRIINYGNREKRTTKNTSTSTTSCDGS